VPGGVSTSESGSIRPLCERGFVMVAPTAGYLGFATMAGPHEPGGEHQRGGAEIRVIAGGEPSKGRGGGGRDLELALGALRARIDEEFKISERLDAKARQATALAAGYFAVIQTVAFGSYAEQNITTLERVFMLAAVVIAGCAVAAVGWKLAHGEALQEEIDIPPSVIVKWCEEAQGEEDVAAHLVRRLSTVAERRASNNGIRSTNYEAVVMATLGSVIFTTFELIIAVVVRI
jgi:hypothetical protein